MMSTPTTITSAGRTVDYLKATEYYVNARDETRDATHWQGAGAEALGIAGKSVDAGTFERLLDGHGPKGERLTANAGSRSREKLGFDCINSPPKSVSVVMAYAVPELRDKIIAASEAANAQSIRFLQDNLTIRTGKGGTKLEPVAGLTVATFTHMTSRALDPQMHHHNAMLSAAMRQDGTWGNIDRAELMALQQTAGAIYQAELSGRLNALGFGIEADEHHAFAFRIKGVEKGQEEAFSQRRGEVLKWLKDRDLDPKDREACKRAAKATRLEKNEPKFRDLLQVWAARGEPLGLGPDYIESIANAPKQSAAETIDTEEILAALTEQQSVFERKDVLKAVAIAAGRAGGMTRDDIEKTTDKILGGQAFELGEHVRKSDRITAELRQAEPVKLGAIEPMQKNRGRPAQQLKMRHLYTTPEAMREEVALRDDFKAATEDHRHDRSADAVVAARALYEAEMSAKIGKPVQMKAEQVAAIEHVATAGRQVLINGLSGTGKSFTMGAIRALEEAAGQRVIGTALAGQAAAGLKDGAAIKDGGTLASILQQARAGKLTLDAKTTIILDEAAMVGARQFRELQKLAPESKIVILGDRLQFQNIERGAWMGGLQDLGFQAAKLTDIERQKIEWHRDAVLNLKDGRGAVALEAFRENGQLVVADTTEATLKKMARDYADDATAAQDKIAMTSTHAHAHLVNDEIRRLKIERGELGSDGYQADFKTKDGAATFSREVREGERLRFTKNDKVLGVFNGELATVSKIERIRGGDAELTLAHDNGKTVKFRLSEYATMEHGYCGTAMGNQGASKHHAYAFLDADSMTKQAGYVLLSRSKQETKAYMTSADCDDAADALSKMGRALSRDGSKDWTLDYATTEQLERIEKRFAKAVETTQKPEIGPPEVEPSHRQKTSAKAMQI
jgi:conjugative relaxase-like TrwC/TraI family protein